MDRFATPCLIDESLLADECAQRFDVQALTDVDSTNTRLMNAPFGPVPGRPKLLTADRQHAGRGRRGRPWVGDAAGSLAMSCAFERAVPPDAPSLAGWPIAVGVAVAETLSAWVGDLRLKWPNDLQRAGGRKCGGILIESRRQPVPHAETIERVVVGTGFNLHTDPAMRDNVDQPIAGLFDDAEQPPRERVVARIALGVLAAWQQLHVDGFAPFVPRWAAFDVLAGRPVRVIENGEVLLEGQADGLDGAGALRVLTPGGLERITVGDVSVRATQARRAGA